MITEKEFNKAKDVVLKYIGQQETMFNILKQGVEKVKSQMNAEVWRSVKKGDKIRLLQVDTSSTAFAAGDIIEVYQAAYFWGNSAMIRVRKLNTKYTRNFRARIDGSHFSTRWSFEKVDAQ